MSKSTDNTTPIVVAAPTPENETSEVVVKQSLVKRGVNFVKTHKKSTIAVAGLMGLVGVSALAGRATAPTNDTASPLELESADREDEVVETETTVAN